MANNPATLTTGGGVRVRLLIAPQCGFCDDAKAILERVAKDYPLTVETVALDSPEGEQLALQGNILFPPGLFLDGEPFSYGRLSERKLRQELERRIRSQTGGVGKRLSSSRVSRSAECSR